jgi:PAS domain S-box-containing protein
MPGYQKERQAREMSRKPQGKVKLKAPLEGTPKAIRPPSQRTLYVVLALVTVFFLVGGYLFYHFQERHMRQRIEDGLSTVAQLKADQIAQWRAERLTDANIIMANPFLIDGVARYMASPGDSGLRDEVLAGLASIGESYPYQDMLLVDLNGSVLLNLNDSVCCLGDMTLAQLAVAIEEHKAVMTDFHYPPNRNSPHLDVVAPLFPWGTDSQEAIGAVVLCVDPSQYLWPLVQFSAMPSETAETFLVERDGDQVLFLNELRHQEDAAFKLRIPLSQQEVPAVMAVLGEEGVVEGKDYRGAEVLAALKHIQDSPWYMVTKIDTSEALSAWLFQAGIIIAFVAGLLIAALAATGLVWQRRQRQAYQAMYQAEVESQALRRHFEYLVKYANDIIVLSDEDQHIVEVNNRALEAYGYRREEMLGLPVSAIIPPGGFSSYRERLRKLRKEGTFVAEAIHQRKDGSTLPVEVSARLIKIEGKQYIQAITRDVTERKKTEQEKSTILAAMSELVIYQDLEHRVVWANEAAYESAGLASGELVGRHCYEVWHKRSSPCVGCPLEQARKTGKFQENEMSSPDGRFWLVRGYPVTDIDGVASALIEVVMDVTERKQAEEALRESEERYKKLADSITDVFFAMDRDLRYTYWNKASEELTGIAAEDALGKHLYDIFPDQEGTKAAEKVYLKVLGTGKPRTFVNEYPLNGKKYWFEVSAYPTETGISVFVRDITERKKAEMEYQTIVGTAMDGFAIHDMQGRFLDVNEAYCHLVGYSRDELMNMLFEDVEVTEQREARVERVLRILKETGYDRFEGRLRRKDGGIVDVDLSVNYLPTDGGRFFVFLRDITERKRAEEALADEATRRRILMDQSKDGISILDENSKLVEANRRFAEMLGYTSEELRDFHTWDWDAQWTREELFEMGRNVDEAGVHLETRHRRKDGTLFDVELSVNRVVVAGKALLFCVSRDVTERKKAEEALRRSEQNFRDSMENSPLGIRILAKEGEKTIYSNRAFLDIWGYRSIEELETVPRKQRYTPESYTEQVERLRKRMRGEPVPLDYELSIVRSDGQVRYLSVSRGELLWGGEKVFQLVYRDITERKQVEEALRLSEQNLRNSIENSPLGIRIADKDGKTIYVNRALLDIWGYRSIEELESVPRKKRLTPADYDEHRKRVDKRRRGEPVPSNYELGIVRKGGQVRYLSVSRGELLWGGEKVFQLVYQDITELKLAAEELEKAVEELQRSNAELERFAYVASHDLQEPLRMVSSYTQLLERRYKDKLDADANDFINYAVGGAERMQELLNDLLIYSRVGTRAKPFKRTDMEAVLEAALDNLQVAVKESKARVTHDHLPTLMADEGQMVQVLQNLIGNAVKFRGKKSPRINVSAEQKEGEWVFSVKDNGIGIEPQYFDRIFLIFQRLHRDEYPGTGTGLAIAKRIVERHGGQIWVESEPGKGSTFYFSIEAAGEKGATSGGRGVKRGKR